MKIFTTFIALIGITAASYGEHPKDTYENLASKYLDAMRTANWTSLVETYHPLTLDMMKTAIIKNVSGLDSESLGQRYGYSSLKEMRNASARDIMLKDLIWGHQFLNASEPYKDIIVTATRLTNGSFEVENDTNQFVLSMLCRSISNPDSTPSVLQFYFNDSNGVPLIERATGAKYVDGEWNSSEHENITNENDDMNDRKTSQPAPPAGRGEAPRP